MKWLNAACKKMQSSNGNEDTSDKGHKLEKDTVANAHEFKLDVQVEDVEELLDMNDHELTRDKIKVFYLKIKIARIKIRLPKSKYVFKVGYSSKCCSANEMELK